MKNGIKNIIFDLGNVILDLDFDQIRNAFQELTGLNFGQFCANELVQNTLLQFELGQISEEAFLNALQRKINPVPDVRLMIEVWNSLLLGIPIDRLELLDQLKFADIQLYLLSNTNSLHIKWLYNYLKSEHGILNFDSRFFKKTYYSHLLKMRKPDKEIFEFVLADAHLKVSETLFIDDCEANVTRASELGMAIILHEPGSNLQKTFQSIL